MKNLLIIGAGRFGREVHAWARQSVQYEVEWRIKGFLDSRKNILKDYHHDVSVLGSPEEYELMPDDVFICAVGEPEIKQRYCELLADRGAQFANLIHKTVVFGDDIHLGTGVILCPFVVVSSNVTLGDFVTVNMHSIVAHDVVIGEYSQIHGNVSVNGSVSVGRCALIGSNAVLLPDSTVGEHAVVGAGSVVLRTVEPYQTVFGNPAKPLRLPSMERAVVSCA